MKIVFNYIEKIVIGLSILSLLLLLSIQFLNYNNVMLMSIISNNRFLPYLNYSDNNKKGVVILKNMTPNYKDVNILINGQPKDSFINDDEISIEVYNNDIIEIDGTKYYDGLVIKVAGVSTNLDSPKLDTTVITSQSIEILSKVILK